MKNLKDYKKCTKEQYEEANRLSPDNTAYVRIGSGRLYYLKKKIIPEFKIENKTITLSGKICDVEKAIEKIKKDYYKVNIK